jgi:heme A synthase
MFLNTLLNLPLPVVLALCALLLLLAAMARVVAGLRRPAVVRTAARARAPAGRGPR